MNYRLKRFIEKTIPNVIGYGLITLSATRLFGWRGGLLCIAIFAVDDVIMIRKPKEENNEN